MAWSREAVAAVRFPVVVATAGAPEPGWVSGFGGPAFAPECITIRYGHPWTDTAAELTTYPGDPFDDLTELVESAVGGEWWSLTQRPPAPPAAPAKATRHEFTIRKIDEPRPDLERAWRARERAIRKAVDAAERRTIAVSLDGVARDADVVEIAPVWAACLRTSELTALLVARSIGPQTLELTTVTDLGSRVGDPPAF